MWPGRNSGSHTEEWRGTSRLAGDACTALHSVLGSHTEEWRGAPRLAGDACTALHSVLGSYTGEWRGTPRLAGDTCTALHSVLSLGDSLSPCSQGTGARGLFPGHTVKPVPLPWPPGSKLARTMPVCGHLSGPCCEVYRTPPIPFPHARCGSRASFRELCSPSWEMERSHPSCLLRDQTGWGVPRTQPMPRDKALSGVGPPPDPPRPGPPGPGSIPPANLCDCSLCVAVSGLGSALADKACPRRAPAAQGRCTKDAQKRPAPSQAAEAGGPRL